MSRQVAIARAEIGEAGRQQRKMAGLLGGDTDPVVAEAERQALAGKARDHVPAEIDRVELDMGERVQQRRPARRRAEVPPPRHLARRAQQRVPRPGGPRRRRDLADRQRARAPGRRQRAAGRRLGRWVGGAENRRRARG